MRKDLKNVVAGEEVILTPITDEMLDGSDQSDGDVQITDALAKEEHEDLVKFLNETCAANSDDLPSVEDGADDEEGPAQDLAHEVIDRDEQNEVKGTEKAEQSEELLLKAEEISQAPETKKVELLDTSKKSKNPPKTPPKKETRVDLGRDLMPEAYSTQNKKMFTLIENWEDVHNAIKTKRLVRAEVVQVHDIDRMITVSFDNIRGRIPYAASGVEDNGNSLVWLVGRTICFVIKMADEKNEGGFFVASRSEGLTALATEVRRTMKVGSKRQAIVSKIEPWGVWVELGGVYGRLEKRDLLHSFVTNIAEVLQPGELIDVMITKISDTGRIQVSLKDTIPDPWIRVPNNYKVASIVLGKVTGMLPNVIFVEVEPGINTLAPFPRFPISIGQKVAVKIRWIDMEKKRMSASIWKTA